jgi:hypothetical protein
MVDVYVAYSECAITLCAVELQIAQVSLSSILSERSTDIIFCQEYILSDSCNEIPIRIFSTNIDRQIIGFSGSKQEGLDQVANILRRHRSQSELESCSSRMSDMETESRESKSLVMTVAPSSPPRKSMFSFIRRFSISEAPPSPSTTEESQSRPISLTNGMNTHTMKQPSHISQLSSEILSQSLFLSSDEKIIANNLTLRFHYLFCTIPLYEFSIDYSYPKNHKDTPMLNRFRLESDKIQEFVGNQILMHDDLMIRAEVIIQIIRVAEILARLRSHHILMMLIFSLQSHSIHRLKTTWAVVHARIPGRWDILQDLVGFGGQKLTSNFCSRQSVEGVSEDIRDQLKLTLPSYLQLPESLLRFLETKDVKTMQVSEHPDGKALTFGILASKEGYPTKGGIVMQSQSDHQSVNQTTTIPNRSCSAVDLQNSPHSHESSSHWLKSIQDPAPRKCEENIVTVKRQFPSPKVLKLSPKFVSKRRFSYPLSRKEISKVRHAINCCQEIVLHLSNEPSDGHDDHVRLVTENKRSSSTNTHNLSHVFGPLESPKMRRLRTQSEIAGDDSIDQFNFTSENISIQKKPKDDLAIEKSGRYRQYLSEKSFAENRPVHGTVKSDGLGEAGGIPKPSGKPCLPYVNGILGRIIRLKEIPTFIKTEIHQANGKSVNCYYCAQSPG